MPKRIPGSGKATVARRLAVRVAAARGRGRPPQRAPPVRAIVDAARARSLDIPLVTDLVSTPGAGVSATVRGRSVSVGSPARLLDNHTSHPVITVAAGSAPASSAAPPPSRARPVPPPTPRPDHADVGPDSPGLVVHVLDE